MSIPATGLGDDERLVVSPRRARHMLDCGNTRLYELLKNKELEFVCGRPVTQDHYRVDPPLYRAALKEAQSTDESATGAAAERRGRPPKVRSNESAAP